MSSDQRARLKQWIESGEAQLYPLTFPQRELWEASPLPVTDVANHICCLIKMRGLLTERDCRWLEPRGFHAGSFRRLRPGVAGRAGAIAADAPFLHHVGSERADILAA